jgi:hypothetical protein
LLRTSLNCSRMSRIPYRSRHICCMIMFTEGVSTLSTATGWSEAGVLPLTSASTAPERVAGIDVGISFLSTCLDISLGLTRFHSSQLLPSSPDTLSDAAPCTDTFGAGDHRPVTLGRRAGLCPRDDLTQPLITLSRTDKQRCEGWRAVNTFRPDPDNRCSPVSLPGHTSAGLAHTFLFDISLDLAQRHLFTATRIANQR